MKGELFPVKIFNLIDDEYLKIVKPILTNTEFLRRLSFHHHEFRSVYGHSLMVSIRSYYIAKILGLDYRAIAIAGLLHDFYTNDWQLPHPPRPLWQAHGFVHANEASINAKIFFPNLINKKIENSIKRHMFPLNIIPPRYIEGWIICVMDKMCSIHDLKMSKSLLKYIGIRRKGDINE